MKDCIVSLILEGKEGCSDPHGSHLRDKIFYIMRTELEP